MSGHFVTEARPAWFRQTLDPTKHLLLGGSISTHVGVPDPFGTCCTSHMDGLNYHSENWHGYDGGVDVGAVTDALIPGYYHIFGALATILTPLL